MLVDPYTGRLYSTDMLLQAAQQMPIPRTSEAPIFSGCNLSEFMNTVQYLLSSAKIDDEDTRVNYLMRYSTNAIRQEIGHLPELDRSRTGKSWEEAKTVLHDFYGHLDERSPLAEFQKWVQSAADHPSFISNTQVNTYHLNFMSRMQLLLDSAQIPENDLSFAFIQGTPSSMKPISRRLIPEESRNRLTPYAIKDTLILLHSLVIRADPTRPAPSPVCSNSTSLSALSTPVLHLSTSSLALPVSSLQHTIKQDEEQKQVDLAAKGRDEKLMQDHILRDKESQTEAEHTSSLSETDQTFKLEIQVSNRTSEISSMRNPPDRGGLPVAARAAWVQLISDPAMSSPRGVQARSTPLFLYHDIRLYAASSGFLDHLSHLNYTRVGVGGYLRIPSSRVTSREPCRLTPHWIPLTPCLRPSRSSSQLF